jgi:hypothetical protein
MRYGVARAESFTFRDYRHAARWPPDPNAASAAASGLFTGSAGLAPDAMPGGTAGAAAAQINPPTIIAVATLVPSASPARRCRRGLPPAGPIIEFIDQDGGPMWPATCRWSKVVSHRVGGAVRRVAREVAATTPITPAINPIATTVAPWTMRNKAAERATPIVD